MRLPSHGPADRRDTHLSLESLVLSSGSGLAPIDRTPAPHDSLRRIAMQVRPVAVPIMDIYCPRCGGLAEPAGHEDARAFYQCPTCSRVWATRISAIADGAARHAPAPRVLIADDSPEMLGLLTAWLEDEGCLVIAVGSGREALDAAIAYRPNVAFVDLVLPPPDGLTVCEILTRRVGLSVVLMTGMSNPDSSRVSEVGAVILLKKPFVREAVVDALTLALEQCRREEASGGTAFATR